MNINRIIAKSKSVALSETDGQEYTISDKSRGTRTERLGKKRSIVSLEHSEYLLKVKENFQAQSIEENPLPLPNYLKIEKLDIPVYVCEYEHESVTSIGEFLEDEIPKELLNEFLGNKEEEKEEEREEDKEEEKEEEREEDKEEEKEEGKKRGRPSNQSQA